jgi:hypothetical protein
MPIQNIKRVRPIEPTPEADVEYAYAIHFDEGPEPQIVVEYAAGGGGKHASEAHAREAVAPYLDQEELPRRLFVDRNGNIRVRDD